ncbi:MAG: O-antigen ligase family protein [Bacteroidia bacterium]
MNLESTNKDIIDTPFYIWIVYFALLTISVFWTNTDLVAPNIFIRVIFTFFLVGPLFRYPYLTPVIISTFATIRLFSVAPFGYLPTETYYYLGIIIIVVLFQLKNLNYNIKYYGLISLLFIAFFSNFINMNLEYNNILFMLIAVLLSLLIDNEKHLKLIEFGFVIVTLVLSVYALIFLKEFSVSMYDSDSERVFWNDPNYLGSVLTLGIIISFFNIIDGNKQKLLFKVFYSIVFILGFITLGLLASRGSFVTLIIPIAYIIFKKTNSIKSFIAFSIIVIIFIVVLFNTESFAALLFRFSDDTLSSGSDRTVIWEKSFVNFVDSDLSILLFGGGTDYANKLCGLSIGRDSFSPHNNFFQILYDYGIFGLFVFITFVGRMFYINKNSILITSLILAFCIISITLVPLMYLPFWVLIVLFINQNRYEKYEY